MNTQTEEKALPELKLSDNEARVRNADIQMMSDMRDERDRPAPELDDMTVTEYYESNRKKDLTYIPPKRSKNDIRIVSGITREKDSTLLSSILDLNLEPNITAFDDEDSVVAELGDNMSDLVKKSREIEQSQMYRSSIYRELISQGDVFVQEVWVDEFRPVPLKELEWNPTKDDAGELEYARQIKKVFSGCRARLVNVKKIYPASTHIENIKDQPAVAVVNYFNRSTMQTRYGQWKRWQYVPKTVDNVNYAPEMATLYRDWNMHQTKDGQVCEVMLYIPHENRFQIYLNGIPMMPCNYPLTALFPSGEIPISQGKFEPITDFWLSKSQPSKTKVDQEVIDELVSNFVIGSRQTRKPPMGNTARKVLGSNVFDPGRITPELQKDQLFPLLPPSSQQINPAEFSFYQLMKDQLSDKSVNEVYSGTQDSQDVNTLGQAQQMKSAQMLKLALAIDGAMNLERQMAWHRIHNILVNWTKPMSEEVDEVKEGIVKKYKNLSVETSLEDGQSGIKMFRFQDDEYPDARDVENEERNLAKKYGQEVRIVYMSPEQLRSLRYFWYITVNPTPKSGDQLAKMIFVQNLQTAAELFGIESMNLDYLKQRYAIMTDENYDKMFIKQELLQMQQQMQAKVQGQPQAKAGEAQQAGKKPLQAMVR